MDTATMTGLAVGVLTAAGRPDIVEVLELEGLSHADLIGLVERVALLAMSHPAADVEALPRYLRAWGLATVGRTGGAV